jgi:hypothetical protein
MSPNSLTADVYLLEDTFGQTAYVYKVTYFCNIHLTQPFLKALFLNTPVLHAHILQTSVSNTPVRHIPVLYCTPDPHTPVLHIPVSQTSVPSVLNTVTPSFVFLFFLLPTLILMRIHADQQP